MATATRPYIVTDTATKKTRLVRATSQAVARNHCARDQFTVRAASANDVLDMIGQGYKAEEARADEPVEGQQPPAGSEA